MDGLLISWRVDEFSKKNMRGSRFIREEKENRSHKRKLKNLNKILPLVNEQVKEQFKPKLVINTKKKCSKEKNTAKYNVCTLKSDSFV